MWEAENRLWFVHFLCKALPKLLKFNKVEKRRALKQCKKSVQIQQLRH